MAFTYDSLQQITNAGITAGTIQSVDVGGSQITSTVIANNNITGALIGAGQVTNAKIASTTITSTQMGTGSVNVGTSVVTGALGTANGGTNLTTAPATSGSAGTLMSVDCTNLGYSTSGPISVNVYTSSTTWSKPAGCTRVRVLCVGAGAGGSGHGEAGGAGGFSELYLDVTGISSVGITIGGGGGGVNYHNVGGGGNTSSFGPYCSATGGEGARNIGGHSGGRPGAGSGGQINLYGGGGCGHSYHGCGSGGASYFGGPSIGCHHNAPHTYDYETWATPGVGGSGAPNTHGRGANGRDGMIVVWNLR